ncbi:unnamed protein product [Lota lota]
MRSRSQLPAETHSVHSLPFGCTSSLPKDPTTGPLLTTTTTTTTTSSPGYRAGVRLNKQQGSAGAIFRQTPRTLELNLPPSRAPTSEGSAQRNQPSQRGGAAPPVPEGVPPSLG